MPDCTTRTEKVTITQQEYDRLQRAEQLLQALEMAGVDNWSGYDYAMEILHQDDEKGED